MHNLLSEGHLDMFSLAPCLADDGWMAAGSIVIKQGEA